MDSNQQKSGCRHHIYSICFLIVIVVCLIVFGSVAYYQFVGDRNQSNKNKSGCEQCNHHEKYVAESTTTKVVTTTEKTSTHVQKPPNWEDNEEIKILCQYLQIPTVHPNVTYKPAIEFLKKQAASLNLPISVYYPVDDENPIAVITWKGSEPELPSIILNSHMDVVPVFEEYWKYPPFSAHIDENGDIFARGSQDTKSIGMQYLAAIRALKQQGIDHLKRTVHVSFVPDEENGGTRGMKGFVKTDEFKAMNIGFMMDEGSPLQNDTGSLYVYYGQKSGYLVEFLIHGQSGHALMLFDKTPGEKLDKLLTKMYNFRAEEMRKLNELKYPYGNVTSINLTILKGGAQPNLIPAEFSATFDIRVSVNADLDEFEKKLDQFCEEAGGNITINYKGRGLKEKLTTIDNSNPYWVAFKSAVDELNVQVQPEILPGGGDSRFLRRLNISALGFSPLFNTTTKLHNHNEYINANTYLKGIEVYKKIIVNVANV